MPRQPNGHTSINKRADGLYHADVNIGTYANGRPKRKHIKRRTAGEVAAARDDLLALLKKGRDPSAKLETLGAWADHWIHTVLKRRVRMKQFKHTSWVDYEKITRVHLVPHLGEYRITGRTRRLEAAHVEELWAQLAEREVAGSYIVRMHRVLRRMLKEAYRAGRADRIVTDLMDAPEFSATKVKALSLREATAVLDEALRDEFAVRWVLGILHGPRQGEVLGIRWTHVVLDPEPGDVAHIRLESQLQRWTWEHGCADPVACVRDRHLTLRPDGLTYYPKPCRTKACPPKYVHGCGEPAVCGKKLAHFCPAKTPELVKVDGVMRNACARHTRLEYCKPCPPACTDHASTCPDRANGGLVEVDPKTDESKAPLALTTVVVDMLRQHRERQIQCTPVGQTWNEDGFVFVNSAGRPVNPREDWGRWSDLLTRAGVKHHRLHAARHTSGTFLSATGSDMRMIQQVLRQTQMKTTGGYVDVALEAQRDAVNAVAAALMDGDLSKILGAKKGAMQ